LDNFDADTQALAAGQSEVESFTVNVSDGTATTPVQVDITVNGANDAPADIALDNVNFNALGGDVADVAVSDVDSTTFTFVVGNPDGSASSNFEVTGTAGNYKLSVINAPVTSLPSFIT